MDIRELRAKLFAELDNMTKEEMIRDLEEAGFVVRHDISQPGVIFNPDGTEFVFAESSEATGSYYPMEHQGVFYPTLTVGTYLEKSYGADPSSLDYSMELPDWIDVEDVKKWTSHYKQRLLAS